MSTEQLTLYHYWRSSCSWRVRWALAIKGVDYQQVAVDILAGEHQQPDYLAKNASGFLPALVINGETYGESLALIDWLDVVYPEPALYPTDPLAKLHVQQLAMTIATGTQPVQNPSSIAYFEADAAKRPEHMRHFIARGLRVYEALLARSAPGPFSAGDELTVADLCLIPQVYNAKRFAVDLAPTPQVAAIYEHCLTLASCQAAAPDRFAPTSSAAAPR